MTSDGVFLVYGVHRDMDNTDDIKSLHLGKYAEMIAQYHCLTGNGT